MLAIARVATCFKMSVYTRLLGSEGRERCAALPSEEKLVALNCSVAVSRAARKTPFKTVCIEQTIAASLMLRRRRIATTAYIGVLRDPKHRARATETFNAHAWLQAGNDVVVGGPDVATYVPLVRFT
jgi:hypothetical protein